jgi:ketosteroid isomerase-like protein
MPGTAEQAVVKKALDDLVNAFLTADKAALEALVSDRVNFVHADGHFQNKANFVEVIAGKKAVYKSISVMDPTVTVRGDTAIVRYATDTEVEAGGRAISLKLVVLQVWAKDAGAWKLLEHQGTKKG